MPSGTQAGTLPPAPTSRPLAPTSRPLAADIEATRADIERSIEPLATRASLYRALWLQTGGIVAAVAGLLAIVARLP